MEKLRYFLAIVGVLSSTCYAIACQTCEGSSTNKKVNVGIDFRVDVDVCVDAGNIQGDFWSTQAVLYQYGSGNRAVIYQIANSDLSGVVQKGNNNEGYLNQFGSNQYGLIFQEGIQNIATVNQYLNFSKGIIIQIGNNNYGTIAQ